jgi:proteasome lid subunit RPN8/RPN11
MVEEIEIGFEGIAYLFGLTNGATTVVIGAMRPEARTTPGSFEVSSVAMARVVRKANEAGLQVVGQIHTHPHQAFHSGGDEDGARIAYDGYVSIVVPDYGRHLPSLTAAAVYFFRSGAFVQLGRNALSVVKGSF